MSPYFVTRCICHEKEFSEIKEYAEANNLTTVKELQAHKFCSTNCKLCTPYVKLMFETGKTAFKPGEYLKRTNPG